MMMRNYYYLVASLPEILIDQDRKDFNLNALKAEVKEHIHPSDYQLVEFLHLTYDNENFLNALLKRGFDFSDLGAFEEKVFEELDENVGELPEYMQDFYYQYTGKSRNPEEDEEVEVEQDDEEKEEQQKHPESVLQNAFFNLAVNHNNPFLRNWFHFLRDFQNTKAAISCRKIGEDPSKHLVGDYPLIEALTKSHAADFGIKKEIDYIDKIVQVSEVQDIIERERRFDLIKWEIADELSTWDYFNINLILAFFIKAGILNRWLKLDPKVGESMFQTLYEDLKETYNFQDSVPE